MKEFFRKIGLIKDFEIRFPIENNEAIELLKSDKNDVKINYYDKLFGSEVPFNSTDFKFDNDLNEFSTNRESKINPKKGRAKIRFKVKQFGENSTIINGIIESFYSDLRFVAIAYGIFISILILTIISSEIYGIEWIFYISGFFLLVTTFMILFQKFETNKAQKALMKYLENKITNANKS